MAIFTDDPVQTEQRRGRMRDELDLFFDTLTAGDDEAAVQIAKRVHAAILDGRVKGNAIYRDHVTVRDPDAPSDAGITVRNCGCLAGLACYEALELGVIDEDLDWFPTNDDDDTADDFDDPNDPEDRFEDAGDALLDAVRDQRDYDLGRIDAARLRDTYGVECTQDVYRSSDLLLLEETIYDVKPGATPDTDPALAEVVLLLDEWIAAHGGGREAEHAAE